MADTHVLMHSPLVGPVTWSWVAEELCRRGHQAVVPSIVAGAISGRWQDCVRIAAEAAQTDHRAVLVGHSGAGALLPLIAAQMRTPPARLVFVDAGVPPASGEALLIPDAFLDHLRALAHGGQLPPWCDWFEPEVIEGLISDTKRRNAVVADLPKVALSYFDAPISMPDGWSTAAAGAYVLLSEIYRPDAIEAATRGWPVIEMLGKHLDLVERPAEVANALESFARR